MVTLQPVSYTSGSPYYSFNRENTPEEQAGTGEKKDSSSVSPGGGHPDAEDRKKNQSSISEKDAELSDAELKQIDKLEKRDLEVKSHERAHIAAGGQFVTSGATFSYQTGPDGKRYAIGGEVSISSGKESSPEATISKMQTIRKAALAPANPSAQDRAVAAEALKTESEARQELNSQKTDDLNKTEKSKENTEEENSIKTAETSNDSPSNTGHYESFTPDSRGSRLDISV